MTARQRVWWGATFVALSVSAAAVAIVGAQAKPSVDASMTQLVSEVRALRLAVERSSLITARTQATLGRVQLQENRLATLGRQLQEVRTRLRQQQSTQAQWIADLATMAKTLELVTPGSEDHRTVEQSLASHRVRVKTLQAEVAQLTAEEAELAQGLTAEQSRWTEFNDRLEALERDLVAASRPQP